jgi:ligand-binding sensor protein
LKLESPELPFYGDIKDLNRSRRLLDTVGGALLQEIVLDYLELLETSAAVCEKDGSYALRLFASGWCRLLDSASRRLCDTPDNQEAVDSGEWLCRESCMAGACIPAIKSGEPVDIACYGGIRIYAVPIRAGDEIVGAINFAYGDPPKAPGVLREIADRYNVDPGTLAETARAYESRPQFLIDSAKSRLHLVAKLIGAIVAAKEGKEAAESEKGSSEE